MFEVNNVQMSGDLSQNRQKLHKLHGKVKAEKVSNGQVNVSAKVNDYRKVSLNFMKDTFYV